MPLIILKSKQEYQVVHIRPGRSRFEQIIQGGEECVGVIPLEEKLRMQTQPGGAAKGLAGDDCPSRIGRAILSIRRKCNKHHSGKICQFADSRQRQFGVAPSFSISRQRDSRFTSCNDAGRSSGAVRQSTWPAGGRWRVQRRPGGLRLAGRYPEDMDGSPPPRLVPEQPALLAGCSLPRHFGFS